MGFGQAVAGLQKDAPHPRGRLGSKAADQGRQIDAVEQLHGVEKTAAFADTEVVEVHGVGRPQSRGDPRFAAKPGPGGSIERFAETGRMHDFDRRRAGQHAMAPAPDFPHAAAADFFLEHIRTEAPRRDQIVLHPEDQPRNGVGDRGRTDGDHREVGITGEVGGSEPRNGGGPKPQVDRQHGGRGHFQGQPRRARQKQGEDGDEDGVGAKTGDLGKAVGFVHTMNQSGQPSGDHHIKKTQAQDRKVAEAAAAGCPPK